MPEIPPTLNPTAPSWSPAATPSGPAQSAAPGVPPLTGTYLFDDVRRRFATGLETLEGLHNVMESTPAHSMRAFTKSIVGHLDTMLLMAKWLVGFLEDAISLGAIRTDCIWAIAEMTELRLDLHRYSWRVLRITSLMRLQQGAFRPDVGEDIKAVLTKDGQTGLGKNTRADVPENLETQAALQDDVKPASPAFKVGSWFP